MSPSPRGLADLPPGRPPAACVFCRGPQTEHHPSIPIACAFHICESACSLTCMCHPRSELAPSSRSFENTGSGGRPSQAALHLSGRTVNKGPPDWEHESRRKGRAHSRSRHRASDEGAGSPVVSVHGSCGPISQIRRLRPGEGRSRGGGSKDAMESVLQRPRPRPQRLPGETVGLTAQLSGEDETSGNRLPRLSIGRTESGGNLVSLVSTHLLQAPW